MRPPAALLGPRRTELGNVQTASRSGDQHLDWQGDIAGDFAEERRRNVAAFAKRNGGAAPVEVSKLLVRPALPDFDEPKLLERPDHFMRLEHRKASTHAAPTI